MPTVTIEKAENGYIMKLNGKVYIADCFGDAMYKCAIAFDEKEVIAMRNEIESDGNKNAKIKSPSKAGSRKLPKQNDPISHHNPIRPRAAFANRRMARAS